MSKGSDWADQSRAEFEAWYERTYGVRAFAKNFDHSYEEPSTEYMWAGWQASRFALQGNSHGNGTATD